jgi:hypothetical protein
VDFWRLSLVSRFCCQTADERPAPTSDKGTVRIGISRIKKAISMER